MELTRNECIDIYNALMEMEIAAYENGNIASKNYFDGDTTFRIIHNRKVLKPIVDDVTEYHNTNVKEYSDATNPNMVSQEHITEFNNAISEYRKEKVNVELKTISYNKLNISDGEAQNKQNRITVTAMQGLMPILIDIPESK